MDNISTEILVIILIILFLLSAFFSGSETALMSVNKYKMRHQAKLDNKGAKAAKKLGIDYAFVDSRLKEAKKVRGLMIAAALCGAATGIAQGMEEQAKIQAESLRKQNDK